MFPIFLLNKNKSQGNLLSKFKANFNKVNFNNFFFEKNVQKKNDFSFRNVNFLNYKKFIENFNNKQIFYEKNFSSIYNDNDIFNSQLNYIKNCEINHNFSNIRNFHKKLMNKNKNKIIKKNIFSLTNKFAKEKKIIKNLSCDNILENKKFFKKNIKNIEIKKILNDEITNVKKHFKNVLNKNENVKNIKENNFYISYKNPILEINPYQTKNPNIYNNGNIMFKLLIEENNLGKKILFKHFNENIKNIKKKLNYI